MTKPNKHKAITEIAQLLGRGFLGKGNGALFMSIMGKTILPIMVFKKWQAIRGKYSAKIKGKRYTMAFEFKRVKKY